MSWRSRGHRYASLWPEYVPVAQRRAQAAREVEKLRKKGEVIQPVTIEGRTIARSFWGKGWCEHLESFGDYSNRLPRGRSYVRNGSVCHLAIGEGQVEAIVSGSELYRVKVTIERLAGQKWKMLTQRCTGKIGSLIELLQGKLSDEIMQTVTDRTEGLFPLPGEIRYNCNCPDWADMCKHISAVMYGIGARLDHQPELLFRLRGVDHEALIGADAGVAAIAGDGSRRTRRRALSHGDLANVFGVELDEPDSPAAVVTPDNGPRPRKGRVSLPGEPSKPTKRARPVRKTKAACPQPRDRKTANSSADGKAALSPAAGPSAKQRPKRRAPFKPSARSVATLRRKLGLSRSAFAQAIGVSALTVANWEKATGPLKPQAKGLAGLRRLHAESWPTQLNS